MLNQLFVSHEKLLWGEGVDSEHFYRPTCRNFRRTGALALAVAMAGAAMAQEADQPEIEEITVTGSRIQATGFTTPTPVTAVTVDDLETMAPGNLIDSVSELPQFFNNSTPELAGSATTSPGSSSLNLRGLGQNRTLTLLNGRRVVPFDREGRVGIDVFPQPAIERMEVVTGGASGAYGTDAVAGVANFIINRRYTGFNLESLGGVTDRGDGDKFEVSATYGTPLGERFHLLVSGEVFEQSEIPDFQGRDWFRGISWVSNPDFLATGQGPREIRAPNVVPTNFTCGGLISARGSKLNRIEFLEDGTYRKFIESNLSAVGRGTTQTQSINEDFGGGSGCNPSGLPGKTGLGGSRITSKIDRENFYANLDFDINNNVTLFAQGFWSEVTTESRANTAIARSIWAPTIFRENAFLPEEIRDIMEEEGLESFQLNRYHSDISRGRFNSRRQTGSITAGVEAVLDTGGFFDGWNINAYGQWGETDNRLQILGYIRTDRIFAAIDAVRDPETGAIVCRPALLNPERYGSCEPLNILGSGRATQAAIEYSTVPTDPNEAITQQADLEQQDLEITASGQLWEGLDAGPVTGAFGLSYRKQELVQGQGPEDLIALDTPSNGDGQGVRGIPRGFAGDPDIHQFASITELEGEIEVKEAFAEVNAPLVASDQIPLFSLNAAARWADYSGSGSIWAWKYGLNWEVTQDLRLRATSSRDVRAANLSERFDTTFSGIGVDDPVTGVQNIVVSGLVGGNPEVDPEEADTITFGAVYQPLWLPGFSVSVDYWDMEVDGAIGNLGGQRLVDDCFAGSQQACSLIDRDPQTNEITFIRDVFININKENASGVDLELAYNRELDFLGGGPETVNLRVFGSWLDERSTVLPGAPAEEEAGDIRAGLPDKKITANLTYTNGPWTLFIQEQWMDGGVVDSRFVEGVDVDDNSVPSVAYTDLRLSYEFGVGEGDLRVYGLVQNLFDRDPPVAPDFSSFSGVSQTNRGLYDILGRRFTLGGRLRF